MNSNIIANPNFITHSNYLTFLYQQSHNLTLSTNNSLNKVDFNIDNDVLKKINIINFSYEYLQKENSEIGMNRDFSLVCTSWVAVKSYYMIYLMFCVIKYLMVGQQKSSILTENHEKAHQWLISTIENNKLKFNNKFFNKLYTYEEIDNFRCNPSDGLKQNISNDVRFKMLIKKLSKYRFDSCVARKHPKGFKTKAAKEERDNYKTKNKVMLFEFFYRYRIKSNYCDLEMLRKDIEIEKVYNYCNTYHLLAFNIHNCMKNFINDLSNSRFNKSIIID